MRRLLTLLICLTMLIPALPATAEAAEQRLVIAITSEESALNLPLEEAFFKANPGVTVEYRLYSSNQLDSLLMTNQADFDMIILGYAGLMDMVEKDYWAGNLSGGIAGRVEIADLQRKIVRPANQHSARSMVFPLRIK